MTEDIDEEVKSGESSSSYKRISDADYAMAREKYELGTAGVTELADLIECSRQALSQRFQKDGVVRGSRKDELVAATKSAAVTEVDRFHDKRLEWIEQTRVSGYNLLKQGQLMMNKEVAEALKAGRALGTSDDNLKAIARYIKTTIEATDARLAILQADREENEETLPALKIEDLTDDDIVRHHKNITGDEDLDVDELLEHIKSTAEGYEPE